MDENLSPSERKALRREAKRAKQKQHEDKAAQQIRELQARVEACTVSLVTCGNDVVALQRSVESLLETAQLVGSDHHDVESAWAEFRDALHDKGVAFMADPLLVIACLDALPKVLNDTHVLRLAHDSKSTHLILTALQQYPRDLAVQSACWRVLGDCRGLLGPLSEHREALCVTLQKNLLAAEGDEPFLCAAFEHFGGHWAVEWNDRVEELFKLATRVYHAAASPALRLGTLKFAATLISAWIKTQFDACRPMVTLIARECGKFPESEPSLWSQALSSALTIASTHCNDGPSYPELEFVLGKGLPALLNVTVKEVEGSQAYYFRSRARTEAWLYRPDVMPKLMQWIRARAEWLAGEEGRRQTDPHHSQEPSEMWLAAALIGNDPRGIAWARENELAYECVAPLVTLVVTTLAADTELRFPLAALSTFLLSIFDDQPSAKSSILVYL